MKPNKNNTDTKIQRVIEYSVMMMLIAYFVFAARILRADHQNEQLVADSLLLQPVELDTTNLDTVAIQYTDKQEPYLGIVLGSDMDFEKAFAMHYPFTYGAIVEEVDTDGPAKKAGILDGDIITRFGDTKVLYNDHLLRLLVNYRVGDNVPVTLFRDGKIMTSSIQLETKEQPKTVGFDLPPEKEPEAVIKHHKPLVFYGDTDNGLFAWNPTLYMPDNTDLFQELEGELGYPAILEDYEVNNDVYSGVYLSGFHLITNDDDNGVKLGIYWANGKSVKRRSVPIEGQQLQRSLEYRVNYWGLTLNKQIPLFDRLIMTPSVLGGIMNTSLHFYQPNTDIVWDQLDQRLASADQHYLTLAKSYFIVQPNAALILKIGKQIGVQMNVGYFYGRPRYDGWKVTDPKEGDKVLNSPDTSIGGWTFSIGPCLLID